MPHGGGQRAARPLGPRVPLPPLAAFSPARPRPALPPRLGCLCWFSVRWASPSRVAGRAPSVRREGAAVPRSRLSLSFGLSPAWLFMAAPSRRTFPLCLAFSFPAACIWRACSARAALAGGNPIQKVLSAGARSERGRFAQGTFFPRLGAGSVRLQLRYRKGRGWYRLPQIGQYRQYSLTGYPQKGQRGPSGACTMTTSYSVRFIGLLPLTFPSVCGRILSKSVMPPWPAAPYRGVRDFVLIEDLFGLPPVQSSACTGGNSVTPRVKGSASRLPGRAFPLPSAMQKSLVTLASGSTHKSGPPAHFFGGLTMRLL